MITEKQKMLGGEMYDPNDPILLKEREKARLLFQQINQSSEHELQKRTDLFRELLGGYGSKFYIEPPFYCDYGYNIILGDNVFINFNCCILDVMKVTIGANSMLGPAVQIYTATHPLEAGPRNSGREFAKPISIGNNVWIGGGAVLCPGVTIGDGAVVGAGAVITKNVAKNTVVGGNPAKFIRNINND